MALFAVILASLACGSAAAGGAEAGSLPCGSQEGVLFGLPMSSLDNWTRVYDAPYSDPTSIANVEAAPENTILFVGAEGPDGRIVLGAMGNRDTVLQILSQGSTQLHNGAYWFDWPGDCFGFAGEGHVDPIGMCDYTLQVGETRLSWFIDNGNGGWRAGRQQDLRDSDQYRKLVYYCYGQCAAGTCAVGTGCTQCPAGTWASSGSAACLSCPWGTWSLPGAAREEECTLTLEVHYHPVFVGLCILGVTCAVSAVALLANRIRKALKAERRLGQPLLGEAAPAD